MMTDNEAIKLAQQGRSDGYQAIYEKYGTYLYTLAIRMLKDQHLAEDAVQDAFSSAFRYISSFKGNSRLKTWLYTILYRAVLKIIRSRTSEKVSEKIEISHEHQELHDIENRLEVKNILAQLPERDRAVLIMAYWDDLTCSEIADIMTIKENHVKILLFRARKKFRELWPHKPQTREVSV